jgi:hypothetical protein
MNDGARIGYSEFVAICHVDDPRDFCGYRLELDGLYVVPPRADDLITPEDRAVLSWHPTGDHSKPALSLPCTLGELRAFVDIGETGLGGCIDEDEVDALPGVIVAADGGVATTKNLTPGRIAAIVRTARHLGYEPLAVAVGGKAAIERECLEKLNGDPHRFTADTFKKAWQAARDEGLIDVVNADVYRGQ